MTGHFRECQEAQTYGGMDDACICQYVYSAYERGRRDAAEDLAELQSNTLWLAPADAVETALGKALPSGAK